jgi:hypothetical protein
MGLHGSPQNAAGNGSPDQSAKDVVPPDFQDLKAAGVLMAATLGRGNVAIPDVVIPGAGCGFPASATSISPSLRRYNNGNRVSFPALFRPSVQRQA